MTTPDSKGPTYNGLLVRNIHNQPTDRGRENHIPTPLLLEILGRGTRTEPRPVKVHTHLRPELLSRHVLGRDGVAYPSVRDQDVDLAAEVIGNGLEDGVDGLFVADVALVRADGHAMLR